MLKNVIFLIPFIFIINSKKIVKIPFHKKEELTLSMSQNEIIKILENNIINTDILIGTPSQKLELNIRTDEHYSYIISEDSIFEDLPPDDLKEYSNSSSQTYIRYSSASFLFYIFKECYYMKDKVEIGNILINNLTLIQAVNIIYSKELTFDSGILGLGIVNSYETSTDLHSNFIVNLKEKNLIENYNFFFHFDEEHNENFVIIGSEPYDYDNKLYKNRINTFARQPTYSTSVYWGFMVDNITYNGIRIPSGSSNAKIKINYGFIGVGDNVKQVLQEQYFNNYLNSGICKEIKVDSMTSNFVCKSGKFNKKDLGILEIFNWEFNIPYKFELSKLFYEYNGDSYFLVQFTGINFITLGEPFIRLFNPVFNQDTKMIGIYTDPTVKKQNIKNNNYYVVLIVLSILTAIAVGILILVLKYKKKLNFKKKKGIELADENYEYINMTNN